METQKMKTYTVELTFDEMKALLDAAEHGFMYYDNSGYYKGELWENRYSNRQDYITGEKKLWTVLSAAADVDVTGLTDKIFDV
jgi:hypothetical protein